MITPAFKKIAVVLRGHIRTWEYISPIVKKFYATIAQEVDYYVVLWETEKSRNYDMTSDFKNENLVSNLLVPIPNDPEIYNGWAGPAYLSKRVVSNIVNEPYDMVFDTRPDIIPVLNPTVTPKPPTHQDYYTSEISIVCVNGERRTKNNVCLDDWMLMCHPKRYSELALRTDVVKLEFNKEWNTYGHQRALPLYIQSLGMKIWLAKWMKTFFIRPNAIPHLDTINFDEGWWPPHKAPPPSCVILSEMSQQWHGLTVGNKLRLINQYNLSQEDWGNEFHWRRP